MTHKRSHTLLGFILLIALASPTVASTTQQANTLTQDDIEFIFGPEANIAAFNQLSPKEMAEIQGEFFGGAALRVLSSFKGIISRGAIGIRATSRRFASYWPTRVPNRSGIWESGNLRFTFGRHIAHHGKPPHWQLTYWQKGTRGQEKHIWVERPIPRSGGRAQGREH